MTAVDVLVMLRVRVETDDEDLEDARPRAVEQARLCGDAATGPTIIVGHVSHIDARVETVAVIEP